MSPQAPPNRAPLRPCADPGPSTLAFRRPSPAPGPGPTPHNGAKWLINGRTAEVRAWSPEEWALEPERPAEFQRLPSGIRVALQIA